MIDPERRAELTRKAEEAEKQRRAEAERKAAEDRKAEELRELRKEKVTRDNYYKIELGMSLKEVQAILGPGRTNLSAPGIVYVTWESSGLFDKTIITIGFENGRVQAKAIVP